MRGPELEHRNENNEINANNVSQIRISPRILPELLRRLQNSTCREEFEIGFGHKSITSLDTYCISCIIHPTDLKEVRQCLAAESENERRLKNIN